MIQPHTNKSSIILALQFYPGDIDQAKQLTQLICDIEPNSRNDVEFAVCYRQDCKQYTVEEIGRIAGTKFARVHYVKGMRGGVGWPHGPNDLWAETMMRLSLKARSRQTQAAAVLTFEPDCIPLRSDWIDYLQAEWSRTDREGLDIFGHAHSNHINGNCVCRMGLLRKHPAFNGAGNEGWDCYHGELMLRIGRDSSAISQHYRMKGANRAVVESLRKNGGIPALFHGIKGPEGIEAIRSMLEDGTFAKRHENPSDPRSDKPCILTLGRYGDILNILPMAQHIYRDQGVKPDIMVAREYQDIQRLVDYADIVPFNGSFHDYAEAQMEAVHKYKNLYDAAVYGNGLVIRKSNTPNFQEEAYWRAGLHDLFTSGGAANIEIKQQGEPKIEVPDIVVNLSGNSSPLSPEVKAMLMTALKSSGSSFLDISDLKLPSFCDLEPILRKAKLVITIDTGTLHLAGAVGTPYVALVADRPQMWHGATTRGNCIMRCRYSEIGKWMPQISAIIRAKAAKPKIASAAYISPVVSNDSRRRNAMAAITRRGACYVGNILQVPLHDAEFPRHFRDNDERVLVYVRDMIDMGIKAAGGLPVIFTNTDTCFPVDMASRIEMLAAGMPCAWGPRRDFKRLDDPVHDSEIGKGWDYVGTDIFYITPDWWSNARESFPSEMLMGAEAWDAILRELMRMTGGIEMRDTIYHERHSSTWEQRHNRYTLPSQVQCLQVAYKWFKSRNLDPARFGVRLP